MGNLLSNVTTQKKKVGLRIFIYAPPKFGKSRFAAQAPNHIFLNLEDGLSAIPDAMATPKINTYEEFKDYLCELMEQDHKFKTLIIDTVDWLEVLISDYIVRMQRNPAYKTIADLPFGRGYPLLVAETRKLLNNELEWLRVNKGMNIICLAHSDRKTITPPMGESYDYYAPKLYAKKDKDDTTMAAWKEWVDILGFGNMKIFTKNCGDGFNEKTQAVGGDKFLYLTDKNPAFLAGSRYKMPDAIPFTYEAFCNAMGQAMAENNNNNTNKGE